jgi:predicted MFS family arabinose efflux permease
MTSAEARLLLVLSTVRFCHIIDFMIVMPLGKTIMAEFMITPGQFAWIVSAYALAACMGNVTSTAFIDRFDRRTALLVLFVGFTVGTLACAFAPTYETLLAARFLTGMFGGVLGALVLAIVGDAIPLNRRASAMGWVMTAFSAASVVGVPAGIWIAAEYGWHMPFLATAMLSAFFVVLAYFFVPSMRAHLREPRLLGEPKEAWYAPYRDIFTNANQRAALLFTLTLMLGHFTIIPFIAPYMQINIGFEDKQVSLIYLIGGLLTVVLLPLLGKLADRHGRMLIFTIASIGALGSIYAITNLNTTSIPLALLVTSSFFVVSSGRTVPATTMITSVVRPENRAGFMSIRQSVNEIALFFSSMVAGFIIVEGADGRLEHYDWLGYFAMVMTLIAVYAASRIRAVA